MEKQLWIGGKPVPTDHYQSLCSPYSGNKIARIAVAQEHHVLDAVASAESMTSVMAKMPSHERSAILADVAQQLTDRLDEAAALLCLEAAKPLHTAAIEIQRTIQTYRFAAEAAKQATGEMIPMDAAPGGVGKLAFTIRDPLGVIGAICPFNFPFNLVAHKVGPAIAAGNTVVLKPASQTPLSAHFIAELFDNAGLPKGALNIITGSGKLVGQALVTHDQVKMITFTGSPPVGKEIRSRAGLKRVTLELGSNSAVILDKGIDIKAVAPRCITAAFAFQGQVCISLQRIYVHKNLYDDFTMEFVKLTRQLKGGDPGLPGFDYSAVISPTDADRILNWLAEARKAGAQILTGGERTGNMISPAVVVNAPPGIRVSCQEVFGPVAVIYPFETMDEAIDKVNDSVFGLQAGIFTPLVNHALDAARRLQVGGVMINEVPTFRVDQMPYGGVKESGMGREGLKYAIEEMTEMKLISLQHL